MASSGTRTPRAGGKRPPARKKPAPAARKASAKPAAKASTSKGKAAGKATRQATRKTTRQTGAATKPNSRSKAVEVNGARDHVRDAWGIGLLLLAALSALALYTADAAGAIGVFLDGFWRGLFGTLGLAAPLALVGGGVMLLREPKRTSGRIVIGAGLTLAAVSGLWHLGRGTPRFSAPLPELHQAAGWFGAAVALPLKALAATWGAAVIMVALLALGLMITTATPPRTVGRVIARAFNAVRALVSEWIARRKLAREQAQDPFSDEIFARDADGPMPGDTLAPDVADLVTEDDAHELDDAERVVETTMVFDGPDLSLDELSESPFDAADALSDTQLMPVDLDVRATSDTDKLPRVKAGEVPAELATMLNPPDDSYANYALPALDLLRTGKAAAGNKKSLDQMTRALEHTLKQFGVDATVARVSRGPTVTRFEIELGPGVKVAAVTKLNDDISYALATPEIRMVAPIPGKSAIGIEVPNRDRDLITLGDVLRSTEAEAATHPLTAGIGVDIAGNAVLVNLAKMPHLLIAGATGSGKSVTMNAIVTSVITRATPAQARMILVDPKRVELNHYEGVPHLLSPVITDPKRATDALAWTVKEMEDRYERLAMLGYRNIDTYNQAVRDGSVRQAPALSGKADAVWEELPYMLLVIDELADLMMVAPRDVESAIVRIAQMARAVGIHLIVATQRPSVDVVTGLIKANIPSRIALAMATQVDSRTIIDQSGAEKLVGHGDMLFLPANASKPHRIQGCYVDEREIEKIVQHCKKQREADYQPGIVKSGSDAVRADAMGDDASDEQLTRAAMELVVRSGLGSTSMLQRKLKVGFARAGRLMDELESMGVVGPSEGPKARTVFMTVDELEQRERS